MRMTRNFACTRAGMVAMLVVVIAVAATPSVQAQSSREKPYDQKLYRLSEILGAVHYLRELCGSSDGQQWREGMRQLIESEGSSAVRRGDAQPPLQSWLSRLFTHLPQLHLVGPGHHRALSQGSHPDLG